MSVSEQANGGKGKGLQIRQVWAYNFKEELHKMAKLLMTTNLWASLDTEFPGTVFGEYIPREASPCDVYKMLKSNVDATNIIQLGITLVTTDSYKGYVWQFNFIDFNLERGDRHNEASIKLLKDQGINFKNNADFGIDSRLFGRELNKFKCLFGDNVSWVGFHCATDIAYMVKMITEHAPLPEKLSDFMKKVRGFFGSKIYDMKHMMKDCPGLHGGLESIAKALKVERFPGKCHQAGYDSFLTLQTFQKMRMQLEKQAGENTKKDDIHGKYGNKIFGLYDGTEIEEREDSMSFGIQPVNNCMLPVYEENYGYCYDMSYGIQPVNNQMMPVYTEHYEYCNPATIGWCTSSGLQPVNDWMAPVYEEHYDYFNPSTNGWCMSSGIQPVNNLMVPLYGGHDSILSF